MAACRLLSRSDDRRGEFAGRHWNIKESWRLAFADKEAAMPDDPNKRENRDRSRAAGGEEHEVRHFAEQNSISVNQARELIRKHGNDREALEREARRMRS